MDVLNVVKDRYDNDSEFHLKVYEIITEIKRYATFNLMRWQLDLLVVIIGVQLINEENGNQELELPNINLNMRYAQANDRSHARFYVDLYNEIMKR